MCYRQNKKQVFLVLNRLSVMEITRALM